MNNFRLKLVETRFEKALATSSLPDLAKKAIWRIYRGFAGESDYEANGIVVKPWARQVPWVLDILNGRIPYVLNEDDWGLANEELPESVLTTAEAN